MGKGSAKKSNEALDLASNAGQTQVKYGTGMIEQAKPALSQAINTYSGLASGNVPGITKFVAPQMQDLERQYAQAEKSIDSMPAGGARDAAKRDLAIAKAGAKNRLFSGGVESGLSNLSNLGVNVSSLGLSGLAGGASTLGGIGEQYNQMASSKGATAGKGVAAGASVAAALL